MKAWPRAGEAVDNVSMADDDIQATQELVAPLMGKPVKARLLKRPPVRFLRNVFVAAQRATGFGDGLFQDAELDDNTLRSKAGKLWFVAKLVALVGQVTGEPAPVRYAWACVSASWFCATSPHQRLCGLQCGKSHRRVGSR